MSNPYEYHRPPAYPQQWQPVPPPKKPVWPWVLGAVGLAVVLGVVGLVVFIFAVGSAVNTAVQPGNSGPSAANPVAPPAAAVADRVVVYKITGTGGATASSINYTTDGMTSQSQESDVKLPWSKTLTLPGGQYFQMVSIFAQGSGKGTIDVTITVDGQLFKEVTAQGYGVALANGDIGRN